MSGRLLVPILLAAVWAALSCVVSGAAEEKAAPVEPAKSEPAATEKRAPDAAKGQSGRREHPPGWEQWDEKTRANWVKGVEWIKHVIVVRCEENNLGPDHATRLMNETELIARTGFNLKELEQAVVVCVQTGESIRAVLKKKGVTVEIGD